MKEIKSRPYIVRRQLIAFQEIEVMAVSRADAVSKVAGATLDDGYICGCSHGVWLVRLVPVNTLKNQKIAEVIKAAAEKVS